MYIDGLVNKFFLKHYKDYGSTLDELDSYEINDENTLVIEHHTKHGKRITSVFSVWDVIDTLLGGE